jgi:hypothetical protein
MLYSNHIIGQVTMDLYLLTSTQRHLIQDQYKICDIFYDLPRNETAYIFLIIFVTKWTARSLHIGQTFATLNELNKPNFDTVVGPTYNPPRSRSLVLLL